MILMLEQNHVNDDDERNITIMTLLSNFKSKYMGKVRNKH